MEPSNKDIYELLLKLDKKVNDLANELNKIKFNKPTVEIPDITIEQWLENTQVCNEHIEILLSNQDGHMSAFKKFISYNNNNNKIPIKTNGKKIDVCIEQNGNKDWAKINDENIHYIIRETWRKFLEHYISSQMEQRTHEELKDIQKLKVMQMKKNLYEVERTRMELIKWLGQVN
tara:strand:+ start:93 stop:617 length:525 start_codon:yes stop_codon:yes gene_type:complete